MRNRENRNASHQGLSAERTFTILNQCQISGTAFSLSRFATAPSRREPLNGGNLFPELQTNALRREATRTAAVCAAAVGLFTF